MNPILRKKTIPKSPSRHGLVLLAFLMVFAAEGRAANAPAPIMQTRRISVKAEIIVKGTVTDNKGESIPGATVKDKNTGSGVATNANGQFTIKVASGNDVLVVSSIGYKTQEVQLKNRIKVNVILEATTSDLDEVVVIGYGTAKKRDLTGAVSTVKPEEITARPGPDPMESLQGRVPGLDITRTSGQAGAGVTIQLRGSRSLTTASGGNTPPLFIIDGLPGDYSTINANDIESIDVLRDAASTAIYGSQGANGVVIITTKSAKTGKVQVDFNSYYGYNGWSVVPQMLTGTGYLQAKRDAYSYVWNASTQQWTTQGAIWQSSADDPTIFGAQRWAEYQSGDFVNWAKTLLQKDPGTQNYSLAVSGGTEKTKAYASFNMQDEDGQYRGDNFKNYSTSIRIDHKIKDWISIGANFQGSYVVANHAEDKLENALVNDPLATPYNPDGSLNTNLGNNVYNLLLDYQPGVYANLDNNIKTFLNPYVEVRPIKGLSILSRAGVQLNYSDNYLFQGIGSVPYTYSNANIARAAITQNRYTGLQWENVLTYDFRIKEDHHFTFTGVSSYYYNQNLYTQMLESNITSNNFEWYKFTGDVNSTATSSYTMSKTIGYVGRLNYSYKDKYLLSGSLRDDGSSELSSTHQWSTFGAASAAWRISQEKFMNGTKKWLDDLKLRFGWGQAGSTANIVPYGSVLSEESTNASLGGTTVPIYRDAKYLSNPDLTWERSTTYNLGADASFLNSRINLSVDVYRTTTPNDIYAVSLPSIYGDYTPGTNYLTEINIASTKNKGAEVALNTRNIVHKDFQWTSNIAFSANNEQVLKITNGTNNVANGNYTLQLGHPVNSFYSYKLNGVWQIGQEADAAAFGVRPGDLNVNVQGLVHLAPGVYEKMVNGTPTYYYSNLAAAQKFNPALTAATNVYKYSANDYQFVGHNSPDWSLGFQNQFKYKSFDLTLYSYMRWGQTINYDMMGWYQPNGFAINASPSRTFPASFNYWTPKNPSNTFPVMNYNSTSSTMLGFSGLNYVDGSFFKIKNATLGYTLPNYIAKKIGLQKLRVYGTATNLLIITKSPLLKGYDPEMNGSLAYPLTRQVVLGLDVSL
jgi:TonB-linked SusC/RagA family outer membrane protein